VAPRALIIVLTDPERLSAFKMKDAVLHPDDFFHVEDTALVTAIKISVKERYHLVEFSVESVSADFRIDDHGPQFCFDI
jgi:hypothetical protein